MEIGDKVKMAADSETVKKDNPEVTGGISLGRKSGTTVGRGSLASGIECEASAEGAASFGNYCKSSGKYSFSANNNCSATRDRATAFGQATKAGSVDQFVCGKYNVEETNGDNLFIVGNGSSSKRSNAFHVTKNGDGHFAGDVYDGDGNKLSDVADKVNKENGKSLSTNDFTDAFKDRLAAIMGVRFRNVRLTTGEKLYVMPSMVLWAVGKGKIYVKRIGEEQTAYSFSSECFCFCTGADAGDTDDGTAGKFRSLIKTDSSSKVCMLKKVDSETSRLNYVENTEESALYVFYMERF